MTDTTPRLALPFLAAGQAQKELFHNEALQTIDAALHAVVETIGDTLPPAGPAAGAAWIVGGAPSGAWAGHAHALATWTEGGWRFVALPEGASVWCRTDGVDARRVTGGWSIGAAAVRQLVIAGVQIVGARQAAIAAPSGGANIDNEARTTLSAILQALRNHGLIATA